MDKEEIPTPAEKPAQRLCSEIQLFDLCDLESCSYKEGRFCKQEDLLARFENIADEDDDAPVRRVSDELEDDEDADEPGFDEFEGDPDDEFAHNEDEWEE